MAALNFIVKETFKNNEKEQRDKALAELLASLVQHRQKSELEDCTTTP